MISGSGSGRKRSLLLRGKEGRVVAITAVVVTGVVVGSALVLSYLNESADGGRSLAAQRPIGIDAPNGPFLFGVEATLAEAERQAPFPLYRPATASENYSSISHVWVQGGGDNEVQVAIEYASSVMVLIHGAPPSAEASFDRVVAEIPEARPVEVHGLPGVMIARDTDLDQANPGSVAFVVAGVEVTVYGDRDLEGLRSIAESIDSR